MSPCLAIANYVHPVLPSKQVTGAQELDVDAAHLKEFATCLQASGHVVLIGVSNVELEVEGLTAQLYGSRGWSNEAGAGDSVMCSRELGTPILTSVSLHSNPPSVSGVSEDAGCPAGAR